MVTRSANEHATQNRNSLASDRDFRALSVQLRDAIQQLIEASDLGPGSRLPSEQDLLAHGCWFDFPPLHPCRS